MSYKRICKVTILILVEGSLQYRRIESRIWIINVTILILVEGSLQCTTGILFAVR